MIWFLDKSRADEGINNHERVFRRRSGSLAAYVICREDLSTKYSLL